jgi:hypothetical protein
MKAGPLPDAIDTGIPNPQMSSFNRHLAISWVFSVQVQKVFTYLGKVQTNASRNLHPLTCGISVKSTIKISKGVPQTLCTCGGTFGPCWGLFMAHRLPLSHIALFM